MGSQSLFNIYVDTNVLINYCTGQVADVKALRYLFLKRDRDRLFTSSLAVAQTITNLQTKKSNRPAFSKKETIDKISSILSHFTIISFDEKDIIDSFSGVSDDLEDNIHYFLSKKYNCEVIITNNRKDFIDFSGVVIIDPKKGNILAKKMFYISRDCLETGNIINKLDILRFARLYKKINANTIIKKTFLINYVSSPAN
mgnify:CR=1 FL=1